MFQPIFLFLYLVPQKNPAANFPKQSRTTMKEMRMLMIFQDTEQFLHFNWLVWPSVDFVATSTSVSLLVLQPPLQCHCQCCNLQLFFSQHSFLYPSTLLFLHFLYISLLPFFFTLFFICSIFALQQWFYSASIYAFLILLYTYHGTKLGSKASKIKEAPSQNCRHCMYN